ncbi:Basic region leucine zipper [Trichostrongylus colubriformis]|uniref:Basic region leucine zipper n=1 Tax=Trichostrongylus colubriformis TaxID=6319 RepID=A0AAN8FEW2_TRICO
MLPVFPQTTFDPQPFTYNPYGYTVPFPATYGTPAAATVTAAAQPCNAPIYYQDPVYAKSSASSCSKSESDLSSDEAYKRRREKRDRNNEAARTSRLRRKAREQVLQKEAEVLQQENEVLKDEVGELKKVLYSLQDEVRSRLNVIDVENVENIVQYQNIDYTYHNQNL